ncbi:MAG: sporulation protein YtfJ [Oscillospiraceae bacterium]|jgi:sporulation protein YtfJ|nr:sporulation protein YtfJ [Oscillospiraceae bacterium]MBQ5342854.1 sporulation protein YtfJ [Oscillospiraceae bacterium]MBR4827906.1 sporulation protein YtfJ [Oscillospiraceae bacterium]MBR5065243.1 sporulation protein YtfJ [Oscillospiraceae bacterium]
MSSERGVNLLTEVALNKIRALTDTGTVIGEPITLPNGSTAVPVSRVSFGFASGGSDLPSGKQSDMFGGGVGGGVTITPIAFLVTQGDSVKIMQLDTIGSTADNFVRTLPDLVDRISKMTGKNTDKKEED